MLYVSESFPRYKGRKNRWENTLCYLFADTREELEKFLEIPMRARVRETRNDLALPHATIAQATRYAWLKDNLVVEASPEKQRELLAKYRAERMSFYKGLYGS